MDAARPRALVASREPALRAFLPAAVLVGITDGPDPGVLLTRRAQGLRRHAGQVSLPGGRIDPADADAEAAAVREAGEEVGLAPWQVVLTGRLPEVQTVTGYLVTPVVGMLHEGFVPRPSATEVASVFTLGLPVLLDPALPLRRGAMRGGMWRETWVWPHPEHEIWGVTASILLLLAQRMQGRLLES